LSRYVSLNTLLDFRSDLAFGDSQVELALKSNLEF